MAYNFCLLQTCQWNCFIDEQSLEESVINIGLLCQEIQFPHLKITSTYNILISRTFAAPGQWIFPRKDSATGKKKEHWCGTITLGPKPQVSLTRCSTDHPASPDKGMVIPTSKDCGETQQCISKHGWPYPVSPCAETSRQWSSGVCSAPGHGVGKQSKQLAGSAPSSSSYILYGCNLPSVTVLANFLGSWDTFLKRVQIL